MRFPSGYFIGNVVGLNIVDHVEPKVHQSVATSYTVVDRKPESFLVTGYPPEGHAYALGGKPLEPPEAHNPALVDR